MTKAAKSSSAVPVPSGEGCVTCEWLLEIGGKQDKFNSAMVSFWSVPNGDERAFLVVSIAHGGYAYLTLCQEKNDSNTQLLWFPPSCDTQAKVIALLTSLGVVEFKPLKPEQP